MALNTLDFRGGVSKEGECTFITWLFGLALYGVVSILLYTLWTNVYGPLTNIIFNILDVATAVIIFFFGDKWRDKKLAYLKNKTT